MGWGIHYFGAVVGPFTEGVRQMTTEVAMMCVLMNLTLAALLARFKKSPTPNLIAALVTGLISLLIHPK